MPKMLPAKKATPGRLKKNKLPTKPENRVHNKKVSVVTKVAPPFRFSRGVMTCRTPIKNIPLSNQPKVFDKGISGWKGVGNFDLRI